MSHRDSLMCITDNQNKLNECSIPPPLETDALLINNNNSNNKENIPLLLPPILHPNTKPIVNNINVNKSSSQSKSLDVVPALELLHEEQIDNNSNNNNDREICKVCPCHQHHSSSSMRAMSCTIIEEEEECGDVLVPLSTASEQQQLNEDEEKKSSLDSITTTATTTNSSNNLSDYTILSNGRLMESEEDWMKRPKVTYDAENNNAMTFRPLRMKCTHCDEAYTKTHDLYAHIRTHQNHTKCPHCGKVLTCMATFVYHVRTHTGEKPYYCPVEGCDFKNAVKYNLKVHLACIRHGGKANLKKFAKVLDLDVCEKSLRKRKDDSVHELGSRRSKKRRKLNKNNGNNHHHHHMNNAANNVLSHSMAGGASNVYGSLNGFYPKQEEYDQFAAQLLFSLSGLPPVYNQELHQQNQAAMDWNMAQMLSMNQAQPQPPPQMIGGPLDINGSVIKSEQQQQQMQAAESNNNVNVDQYGLMKAEQFKYYDPLGTSMYGYYSLNALNGNQNENKQSLSNSTVPSTMWDSHHINMQNQQLSAPKEEEQKGNGNVNGEEVKESVIEVKEEPIYDHHSIKWNEYLNQAHAMPEYMASMNSMTPSNLYYQNHSNNYYLNYDNQHLLYSANHNNQMMNLQDPLNMNMSMSMNMNHQLQQNENKKIEVPPLPPQLLDDEATIFDVNR